MRILDLTAGNRAIWFDKNNPLAKFIDKRKKVKPDYVCDLTKKGPRFYYRFDLFVFDPPHVNTGKNSEMSKRYGHSTTKQILKFVESAGEYAYRNAKLGALMAFKWNTHDIRLQRALDLMPQWEPLFGHLTKDGPGSQTYWVMLRRK